MPDWLIMRPSAPVKTHCIERGFFSRFEGSSHPWSQISHLSMSGQGFPHILLCCNLSQLADVWGPHLANLKYVPELIPFRPAYNCVTFETRECQNGNISFQHVPKNKLLRKTWILIFYSKEDFHTLVFPVLATIENGWNKKYIKKDWLRKEREKIITEDIASKLFYKKSNNFSPVILRSIYWRRLGAGGSFI